MLHPSGISLTRDVCVDCHASLCFQELNIDVTEVENLLVSCILDKYVDSLLNKTWHSCTSFLL